MPMPQCDKCGIPVVGNQCFHSYKEGTTTRNVCGTCIEELMEKENKCVPEGKNLISGSNIRMTDLSPPTPIAITKADEDFDENMNVCEELLTQLFTLYAEISKETRDITQVSPEMKSAYAKVLTDKSWRATKLAHSFNQEILARIGVLESRWSKITTDNQ